MAAKGRVRVLVRYSVGRDRRSLEETYHKVSIALRGTPGLIGNQLLRSATDPTAFVIMSDWADMDAFRAWADDRSRHGATGSLRRFRADGAGDAMEIYEVEAAY